jgi:hypothetical protein
LLVVITNDGTRWSIDTKTARKHYGPCDPPDSDELNADEQQRIDQQNRQQAALDLGGHIPAPELLTSLAGLNKTRGTRYQAELARARALFCPDGDGGASRLFVFELPEPKTGDRAPVPMSWALSSGDCEFMLGEARSWPPNFRHLLNFATALKVAVNAAELERELQSDAAACKRAPPSAPRS